MRKKIAKQKVNPWLVVKLVIVCCALLGSVLFFGRATITGTTVLTSGIAGCGKITAGGLYALSNDVSASGTCFTIAAADVTLDCQHQKITYGKEAEIPAYGVQVHGQRVTVKNCVIEEAVTGLHDAIYYDSYSPNGFILDNAISAINPQSRGIVLQGSNALVQRNEIMVRK